jgi:transcriptional regulator with XRE-family HTH domain
MLQYLREKADLSQEELGELAGVSHTQISRIETGVSVSPRRGTIRQLAEALRVDQEVLVIRDAPDEVGAKPEPLPDESGPTPEQVEDFERWKREKDRGPTTEGENAPDDTGDRAP